SAPQLVPFGPLPLSPAASALHYGQSIFEGFKAHRTVDGGVALFRPADNLARLNRSAARLAMRPVPPMLLLDGIAALVRLDREWTPVREGGAVMTSPVGAYFSEPVRLVAEERFVRAFPGGTGDVKPSG